MNATNSHKKRFAFCGLPVLTLACDKRKMHLDKRAPYLHVTFAPFSNART